MSLFKHCSQKSVIQLFSLLAVLILSISCQNSEATNTLPDAEKDKDLALPLKVEWENKSKDFGRISQGKPVSHHFKFKVLEGGMKIEKSDVSCGCTTADYADRYYQRGDTGSVFIEFNAKKEGEFKKAVRVYYSPGSQLSDEPEIVRLDIDGEVVRSLN